MAIDLNLLLPPDDEGDGEIVGHHLAAAHGEGHAVHHAHEPAQGEAHDVHPFDLNIAANDPDEDLQNIRAASGPVGGQEDDQLLHAFDLNMPAFQEEDGFQGEEDVDGSLDQEAFEGLQDCVHDFSVYAGDVDVIFDEEELEDSDDDHQDDDHQDDDHQSNDNQDAPAQGNSINRHKNLTDQQRQQIYATLLSHSANGKLKRHTTKMVAEICNVHVRTVRRILQRVKQCRAHGIPVDVSSKKVGNCGRKKIGFNLSQIATIPIEERNTIRKLGKIIGVKRSTLHRWFKQGLLRRHSNSLKPCLKDANKKKRLQFCVSMIDPTTLPNNPTFIDMRNIVHIDEKWFNATKKTSNAYLLPDEQDPYRAVQNKNSIKKVMFLTAVTRPRTDEEGNNTFDGKLGVWAFVRKDTAKRKSRNRDKGTPITKSVIVTRDIMRQYLITKVLPATRARWPREDAGKTIWIQQDNAKTHVPVDDEQFAIAVAQTGMDIRLMNQPANSPDMNILDLGFFASLQSLTSTYSCKTMEDIIEAVQKEFGKYDADTLNKVFLTLQGCLIEVMKDRGGNRYKTPHMNKDRLKVLGILPDVLSCDRELYESVMQLLASS